jgi:hypothetical protein
MTNVILIRLLPSPTCSASDFAGYLTGLEITAYDRTVYNTSPDVVNGANDIPLGSTTGVATVGQILTVGQTKGAHPAETLTPSIIQHYTINQDLTPWLDSNGNPHFWSIATAVIVVNIDYTKYPYPHAEYPVDTAYDIRLEITRNGFTLPTPAIEYNIQAQSIPFGTLTGVQGAYMLTPESMYYILPQPPAPNATPGLSLTLDPGGQPPNFDALVQAIDNVLLKDSPATATSLAAQQQPLTVAQCGEIASEIVYDRDVLPLPNPVPEYPPPPTPPWAPAKSGIPPSILDLYTEPNSDMDNLRQKFEAALTAYHATNDALASKLAVFVYAVSMAVDSEQRSASTPTAGFSFPVDPSIATNNATIDIVLTPSDPTTPPLTGTINSFVVPAAYFYALGTSFPSQLSPAQRYQAVVTTMQATVASKLDQAVKNQVLGATELTVTQGLNVTIDAAQAVRRLNSLAASVGNSPDPQVYLTGPVQTLVNSWLSKPDSTTDPTDTAAFDAVFWTTSEFESAEYLNLLLQVIASGNQNLVNAILGTLPGAVVLNVTKASDLKDISNASWLNFFQNGTYYTAPNTPPQPTSQLLPPYTKPGSIAQQVQAFINYIQTLFTVGFQPGSGPGSSSGSIPAFGTDGIVEVLQAFMDAYAGSPGTFSFATPVDPTKAASTATALFPGDATTANWVAAAALCLSDLYAATKSVASGNAQLQFSCMEALYARGFTSAASVIAIPEPQFQAALTGTVAYGYYDAIYTAAGGTSGGGGPGDTGPADGFAPVNDGTLVDCIPPCNLSPFGPVEYLHELLSLSVASTGTSSTTTLGALISTRRGPVGNLLASMANTKTEVPQIDLILESLEAIGGNLTSAVGAVNNTSDDAVADFKLGKGPDAYSPDSMLSAIPVYSSPVVQTTTEPAYTALASTFTAPSLPYSQSLDICRNYASKLGTDRFELMRIFRQDITEFALDPPQEPAGFQRHLSRLPVRLEIALEYLQISQAEYLALFSGTITLEFVTKLYGIAGRLAEVGEITVPWFLEATGLSYCEFLELTKSGITKIGRGTTTDDSNDTEKAAVAAQQGEDSGLGFPDCLPCCPQALIISNARGSFVLLGELIIFIRLWKKLQLGCHGDISFARLADICVVLGLFTQNQKAIQPNPDFIRQLAALLMLKEWFCLPWMKEGVDTTGLSPGADRTYLLGLWADATAHPAAHAWAVPTLLSHLQNYAKKHFKSYKQSSDPPKVLADSLTKLSLLTGFTPEYPWNLKPTCTIRMAEVLAKICASPFTIGEILFLFTANDHLDGDDPFPLTSKQEAHDQPLDYPRDRHHNISILREKLLKAEVEDDDTWSWYRIESLLRSFGLSDSTGGSTPDPLIALAEHFFPETLEKHGHPIPPSRRRYTTPLSPASTTPNVWSAPPHSPFHYSASNSNNTDNESGHLWISLPLRDKDVLDKLQDTRQLNAAEIAAVRNLYFAPRAALAPFAPLFPKFNHAVDVLVQEPSEDARFAFFARHVRLFHRRCTIIASHVAAHVAAVSGHPEKECGGREEQEEVAWRVLRSFVADENSAVLESAWESDSGAPPMQFAWDRNFAGSGFAALLGLLGTGLVGRYEDGTGSSTAPTWAEMRGGLCAFGDEVRNERNEPVVTVIPGLGVTPSAAQKKFVAFNNGVAMRDEFGEHLGGAQPFKATWTGKLLICRAGEYEFVAEEKFKECCSSELVVTVHQGQRHWDVVSYSPSQKDEHCGPIYLQAGAYTITVSFTQIQPKFDTQDDLKLYGTGFEVKYKGPDTEECLEVVPFSALFQPFKDGSLASGMEIEGTAGQFLRLQYTSSLRDIRRTYQRAFKAVLFAHRFHLSAKEVHSDNESELGFMLAHPDRFVGTSYYQASSGAVFTQHQAYFDFNFLPVLDPYHPPTQDPRASPSPQRQAAMFDWWERTFDYVQLRADVKEIRNRPVWLMFEEAALQQPSTANELVRHLEIDSDLAPLVLTYFATPMYQVAPTDLLDERWTIRLWHGGHWIREVQQAFYTRILDGAQPALWASDDPGLPIGTATGNQNLTHFVQHSLISKKSVPPRFRELESLNNGLRERARHALFAYLCNMNRVSLPTTSTSTYATSPADLSDLLLQDVETGLSEHTSRIDDGIHAAHTFVHRARLGLEPSFSPTPLFLMDWESTYASFSSWVSWKRRAVYRENWLQWDELQALERYEGFRFFREQLRRDVLALAVPGRPMWWESPDFSTGSVLQALQKRELAGFAIQQEATPEGLTLIGTPMNDGQPSVVVPIAGFAKTVRSGNATSDIAKVSKTAPTPAPAAQPSTVIKMVTEKSISPATSTVTPTNTALQTRTAQALASNSNTAESAIDTLTFIPLWIQAAIRLGTRFVRIAAAGQARPLPYLNSLIDHDPFSSDIANADVVDEYYFWLQRADYYAYSDAPQDASVGATSTSDPNSDWQADPSSNWEDTTQLPGLLLWDAKPTWHLFWTRVRLGRELDPPRRSPTGVPIDPTTGDTPFLAFQGRGKDSLYFTAVAGAAENPTTTTPSPPTGFRYDLVTDSAVLTPVLLPPPPPPPTGGGSGITPPTPSPPVGPEPAPPTPLAAFPTFVYFQPGKPLVPSSAFGIALSVAGTLRLNCRFEQARRWCRFDFDPMSRDNTWAQCKRQLSLRTAASVDEKVVTGGTMSAVAVPAVASASVPTPSSALAVALVSTSAPAPTSAPAQALTTTPPTAPPKAKLVEEPQPRTTRDPPCCPCGPVAGRTARARVITLEYVSTLLEWGDHLLARNTPEAASQALIIYDTAARLLGPRPAEVQAHDVTPTMTVSSFVASPPPLNPRLLELYDRCADRRALVHDSASGKRLVGGMRGLWDGGAGCACGSSGHDRAVGKSTDGVAVCGDCVGAPSSCFERSQPYRFTAILPRAYEWTTMLKSLGSELLSAYEKGDAEVLAALRTTQERQILDLGLQVGKNTWRAADWDVQALDQAMNSALTKFRYYTGLEKAGLNAGEYLYITGLEVSAGSRTGATISEGIAQGMQPVPDLALGVAGMGPYQATQLPIGSKLAKGFTGAARIMNIIADIASTNAGLAETQAGWQRRSADWQNQIDLATVEIQQVKRQQLASWRRRAIALRQLNTTRQQILHAEEVQNFMRDKFTKGELYLFLQQETAAQFRQVYNLAMKSAYEVQEALRFERGNIEHEFLNDQMWDDLHEGLLSGERIELALRRMERTYMELNCREYELTKAMSLRLHFPTAFLQLKASGACELEIPEWMFDLDHPGHYMRRIKSVTVTVGCVAGPYTGVHCRLQLLSSRIRFRPLLTRPEEKCCNDCVSTDPNACGCDDCSTNDAAYYADARYIATRYGSTQAIATSTGQDDSGLFTVNFADERYLPFEYSGAISRWRLELPRENNAFDTDSLTDVVLHVSFTARDGGPAQRKAANEAAQRFLPGRGVRFFDLRHEWPDAWAVFRMRGPTAVVGHRQVPLRFTRGMFPFIVGRRAVKICAIHVFIQGGRRQTKCGSVPVRYVGAGHDECPVEEEFACVADQECVGLYHGKLKVELGPVTDDMFDEFGILRFEKQILDIGLREIYLLCDYQTVHDCY